MAKDPLRYRVARKRSLGSPDVERCIGMTALRLSADHPPANPTAAARAEMQTQLLQARPVALMKWSFDDFIVEEIAPPGVLTDMRPCDATSDGTDNHDGNGAHDRPESGGSHHRSCRVSFGSVFVRVYSEGVPDEELLLALRRHAGSLCTLRLLTPIDFVSSTARFVWARAANQATLRQAFSQPQQFYTRSGEVYTDAAQATPPLPHPAQRGVPLDWLPDMRYTVVLRHICQTSLTEVLRGVRGLMRGGVLNYAHMARHGCGALRSFQDAQHMLQRAYTSVVQQYVCQLGEGGRAVQRELPRLCELIADTAHPTPTLPGSCASSSAHRPTTAASFGASYSRRQRTQEWNGMQQSIRAALREDGAAMRRTQTGLYLPHHVLLEDFVARAADGLPHTGDLAHLLRHGLSRMVLREKMRVATEVHFNALASLRWSCAPAAVQVGDWVVSRGGDQPGRWRGDVFEGTADHIPCSPISNAYEDWTALADEDALLHSTEAAGACLWRGNSSPTPRLDRSDASNTRPHDTCGSATTPRPLCADRTDMAAAVQTVSSPCEAAEYGVEDVVLPLYGRDMHTLPDLAHGARHRLVDLYHTLAEELALTGLSDMRSAERAGVRRLCVRPTAVSCYIRHAGQGWEWGEGDDAAELQSRVYTDAEGIPRVRSPWMMMSHPPRRPALSRRGIVGEEQRRVWCKPVRPETSGMMCVLRFTVPRGTPVTSVLREVFQITTLSPSAVFRLLC